MVIILHRENFFYIMPFDEHMGEIGQDIFEYANALAFESG